MKKIVILVLLSLIFVSSYSQNCNQHFESKWIEEDKAAHLILSSVGSVAFMKVAEDLNIKNPEVVGMSSMLLVGLSKELFIDDAADYKDLTADIVGCLLSPYLNRWFDNIEIKKMKKRDLFLSVGLEKRVLSVKVNF